MLGQELFLKYYSDYDSTTGYNKIDFIHRTDGTRVELKTDFYDMMRTPNFFFERYSNDKTKTLGGPFSAAEAGVDYFIYFFIKNSTAFWFRPIELVEFLLKWDGIDKLVGVPNRDYITLGCKVPRKLVKHLCFKKEIWE